MAFWSWSRLAGSNASADTTINWAEGQAPSSVNDSARAMMARTAEWRDDISGAITTGGTSTAYTLTSYQVFDTLPHMAGQMVAFVPNATNTNAAGVDVTLNVDGLGAKPIRMQPSVALPSGTLVLGTPYVVVYNNTDAAFYLRNMTNPYSIPLGGGLPYFGTAAPNSSFALPFGQAISRSTYATLFSLVGTTYGVGDGSTTFNVPDVRGRVLPGKDNMGGSAAGRLGSIISGSTLGAAAGAEVQALITANLPAYTPVGSVALTGGSVSFPNANISSASGGGNSITTGGFSATGALPAGSASLTGFTFNFTGTAQGGSSTAFGIMQPSLICNYILRII